MRDGISLVPLSAMGSTPGDGSLYSVVALVTECKPVCWVQRRRDSRMVEHLEFFLSDDSVPLFKVRCWGEAALHAASRLKAQSVYLFDRLEVHCNTGASAREAAREVCGVWSRAHTCLHLLCAPPEPLLVQPARYPAVARRVDAILAHISPSLK